MQLTEPILSRFDILCVVRDNVDPVEDDLLADFVIGNHRRMHPDAAESTGESALNADAGELQPTVDAATLVVSSASSGMPTRDAISGVELIPHTTLRKYIAYARDTVHPKLEIDDERLSKLYVQLREQSVRTGSVPITVRNIESMIRIAEAHAKLHLRTFVSDDDVRTATRIMLQCFVSTQKKSVMDSMRSVSCARRRYASAKRAHFAFTAF